MEKQKNQITWLGVHLFLLPCIERTLLAKKWLLENAHDMEKFKNNFPDAVSPSGLLPTNDELKVSVCSSKCLLHEDCMLPQRTECPALTHMLQQFKSPVYFARRF